MESAQTKEKNFLNDFGLEVTHGQAEVGKIYPVFGVITEIINLDPGCVVIKLNHNITAYLNVTDIEQIKTIKERLFESAIFVAKILKIDPEIEIDCQTIVFGKKQQLND
ncbi:MAG: hypothetical protein IT292_06070 [Deltaproteobacteria bacterium]|nr:hypothetical protein [Deltaproteobacteria bacterium]